MLKKKLIAFLEDAVLETATCDTAKSLSREALEYLADVQELLYRLHRDEDHYVSSVFVQREMLRFLDDSRWYSRVPGASDEFGTLVRDLNDALHVSLGLEVSPSVNGDQRQTAHPPVSFNETVRWKEYSLGDEPAK